MYCKKCGGKLESYASNCAFCGAPVEKYETKVTYVKKDKKDKVEKPMTIWKWIGLFALNLIPVIGNIAFIVLLVKWGFSKKNNDETLKSYSKATLLILIIGLIVAVVTLLVIAFNLPEIKQELLEEIPNLHEALNELERKLLK